jgi:hypothetical protein
MRERKYCLHLLEKIEGAVKSCQVLYTNLSITNLFIGPRTDAYFYNGSYPTTIDSAKVISHTVDDSYIRMDLSALQNPLMTWNTRLL